MQNKGGFRGLGECEVGAEFERRSFLMASAFAAQLLHKKAGARAVCCTWDGILELGEY